LTPGDLQTVVGIHAYTADISLLLTFLMSFKRVMMTWTQSCFAIISEHWRLTWLNKSATNNLF